MVANLDGSAVGSVRLVAFASLFSNVVIVAVGAVDASKIAVTSCSLIVGIALEKTVVPHSEGCSMVVDNKFAGVVVHTAFVVEIVVAAKAHYTEVEQQRLQM